jgi:ADP-heptose:LPS heptosyltransferase
LPTRAFHFGGGLGDHLLCSAIFHELHKRGITNCWMLSHYPELFEDNPYSLKVVEDDWRTLKLLDKIGRPSTLLFYGEWIGDSDKIKPPKKHILEEMFIKTGISGEVALCPYWHANTDRNNLALKFQEKYVCVQCTSPDSSTPMKNKCWSADRMQNVIQELGKSYEIVQLGTDKEPLLNNVLDGRSLTIKESANLLAHAEFFIGQVGFLMHLARAVETRSVIIYGGREKAWQSGYPCNENIETNPECSPCWQNNRCDFGRTCMEEIEAVDVINAIHRLENRIPHPLETVQANLEGCYRN